MVKTTEEQHSKLVKAVSVAGGEYSKVTAEATAGQMKALLGKEVLKMFEEVGRIRESKRSLEHEMGELFRLKAKYTPARGPKPAAQAPPTPAPGSPGKPPSSAPSRPPSSRPPLPIPRT